MLVEIWSDVVCPWCYIGKRRFEAALARFEHSDAVEVRWRSFELDPRAPFRRAGNMAEHLAAKYGMTVEQAQARLADMDRMAAGEGLAFDLARTQGGNTLDAHRLIHLAYEKGPAQGAAMKEALLHAYFIEFRPISEPDVLVEVGVAQGLDRDEVEQLLASDRFEAEVRADEAEAADLGATGVPFFVVDRAFAVPGAQDPEVVLQVLRRAWERRPALVVPADGEVCEGDSCAI
ncbi:MAG TPA: DsbA family oxidoreductase [Acidimicrobiales bacterium]|nr:DsbA family oxidoreductase [Acidimicrobiales bacterium]